ncbi:MAG: hypothetical protein ACK6AD_11365 [Cyanobacteriota bacterium]
MGSLLILEAVDSVLAVFHQVASPRAAWHRVASSREACLRVAFPQAAWRLGESLREASPRQAWRLGLGLLAGPFPAAPSSRMGRFLEAPCQAAWALSPMGRLAPGRERGALLAPAPPHWPPRACARGGPDPVATE